MKLEVNYLLTVTNNYRLSKLSTLTQLHLIRIAATMMMTSILTMTILTDENLFTISERGQGCSKTLRAFCC